MCAYISNAGRIVVACSRQLGTTQPRIDGWMPVGRLVKLAAFKLDVAIGKNREIQGREEERESEKGGGRG